MPEQIELLQHLESYDPDMDIGLVERAYHYALKAHGEQTRESGDPYFSHPLEVATILAKLHLDAHSIATALLHDTVEDTGVSLEEIEQLFGEDVARLVDGVSKLSRIEMRNEIEKQAENFRKLVLAMSSDIRVLIVKLADRLHNMRTLFHVKDDLKKRRIARETIDIYAPLAERMGMQSIKDELEDLAFMHLNPEMHESIKTRLHYLYQSSENTIESIIQGLKDAIDSEKLKGSVSGRIKTPYSIWCKMQRKNVAFEQLSDIMAFRIIVFDMTSCYQALGIMHNHFRMVPGRFKDYISTPKANNYRSLHTGIIGPLNHRIEIQIRTDEMHQIAEIGIAAHWQYKTNNGMHDGRQYAWLRGLLEILDHASNPEEFLEHTKLEMFQDQVFCFTPKGELIALPKGATPIDFAYAIHSQIGDCTVGCKINGKQMPLRTLLNNGDQVDVITSKARAPSPTWERFVVTGKARASIRRFVRGQKRDQFAELGKSMITKACIKANVHFSQKAFQEVANKFNAQSDLDLFASVGEGITNIKDVLFAAYPEHYAKPVATKSAEEKIINTAQVPSSSETSVSIQGLIPGMAVHYAGCCHPLPGDRIIGVVVTGRGITIHTQDCESLSMIGPERLIDISWDNAIEKDERHVGRLKVTFFNRQGALAAMSTSISKTDGNITNLKITNRSDDFWDVLVDVEVRNLEHLGQIKGTLRSLPIITFVERI